MTDDEFDLLDELYFLQSYAYLTDTLSFDDAKLKATLKTLLEKGWAKCYDSPDRETAFDADIFENEYSNYYYLASKKGLFAHNSTA